MPRLRETPEQKADRMCREALAAGLVRVDLKRKELAEALGISKTTLCSYTNTPRKFTVGLLRKLYRLEVFTQEDIIRIICMHDSTRA